MTPRERAIEVPSGFDFAATVWSHGWSVLAPSRWDPAERVLSTRIRLPDGRVAAIRLSQPGGRGAPVRVGTDVAPRASGWRAIESAAHRSLDLDRSLATFHALCREAGSPWDEAPELGFGRLYRSPTLFEDLVKVLATTNTNWGGTKAMVAALVDVAGPDGAFPTAGEVAAVGPDRLRSEARWGYRAESLAALAEAVAEDRLDLDRWESWDGETEALEAEVLALRGFGPYAAAQVLALLGRYDRIGVDSVFRTFVRERHFPRARKPPSDARMLKVYARWGRWRMLAYWFEVWHAHFEQTGEV